MSRLTAGRSGAGSAARDGSERPSFNAKHYHGSIGTRYGPVSCSDLLGGDVFVQPQLDPRHQAIELTRLLPPLARAWVFEDYSNRFRMKLNVGIIDQAALAVFEDRVSRQNISGKEASSLRDGFQFLPRPPCRPGTLFSFSSSSIV